MPTAEQPEIVDGDGAPVDVLASLFDARGWQYEYVSDDEILGEIQGSWANYQLRGIWRPEDNVLQLLCLPDIRVPDDKRAGVFEVLSLINEQLWLGHFELWSASGLVLFRHAALLEGEDGAALSLQQAETLVEAAIGADGAPFTCELTRSQVVEATNTLPAAERSADAESPAAPDSADPEPTENEEP